MKIEFKTLQYQIDAVNAVVDCFMGQPKETGRRYAIDQGTKKTKPLPKQQDLQFAEDIQQYQQAYPIEELDIGFANETIKDFNVILENIRRVQTKQNLAPSNELITQDTSSKSEQGKNLTNSPLNLNVEMETGTGKTYCYIRTIMELNQRYGWSKFIIVVPSIAIREGVAKTFKMTEEHFLREYGKKPRYFVYDSDRLHKLEDFSSDNNVNVMIINVQAFNTIKEGANNKTARKIYAELDEFASRRPIDVIRKNRPILILDEPQKMQADNTLKALSNFNPLFILRYSATHKKDYNLVYRLDALDAYNQKLVKKISVKGIEVKGLSGSHGYLYLQDIEISKSAPIAKLDMEIKVKSGVKRQVRNIKKGDDLFVISNEAQEYKGGYTVSEIDARENSISFINGQKIYVGEALGQVDEIIMRRIQIRETIKAHLEKERLLYKQGIKVLSLFFIDDVSKYRQYNPDGEQMDGEYAKIFIEEYQQLLNETLESNIENDPYLEYLKAIDVQQTHEGYFSIDKNKQLINPAIKLYNDEELGGKVAQANDIDAYDLILKDKETLLSFPDKTDSDSMRHKKNVRFIFSHSALREGWDNPNVFVICTLKNSDNTISRRQEVGRGLRLAVRQDGMRMDSTNLALGEVHHINNLTVVTNESYTDFVGSLQKEISNALSSRPMKASVEYFTNKVVTLENGSSHTINEAEAKKIFNYLIRKEYIDDDWHITDTYHKAIKNGELAPLPDELQPMSNQIVKLINGIFDQNTIYNLIENDNKKISNPINQENFCKKEFLALWQRISRKATFEIQLDSLKLVKDSIKKIEEKARARNNNLVESLSYKLAQSTQKDNITDKDLVEKQSFNQVTTSTKKANLSVCSKVKYDLIGSVSEQTNLTRQTAVKILKGINSVIFSQFKNNPEAFIREVVDIINEAQVEMVLQGLKYDILEQNYDMNEVFISNDKEVATNSLKVGKHIFDYIILDSKNEQNFALELEGADEVVVYAKLPDKFYIPTPFGKYNPDWAIAFNKDKVRHIYFIAETKGSIHNMDLRGSELGKIESAKRFFAELNQIDTNKEGASSLSVEYGVVNNFDELLRLVG